MKQKTRKRFVILLKLIHLQLSKYSQKTTSNVPSHSFLKNLLDQGQRTSFDCSHNSRQMKIIIKTMGEHKLHLCTYTSPSVYLSYCISVYHTLVSMYHALVSMYYTLVSMYHALVSMHQALFSMYHALVSMYYTLVSMYPSLVSMYQALVSMYHALLSMYYTLVSMYPSLVSMYN